MVETIAISRSFLKGIRSLPLYRMDSVIGRVGGKCLLTIHFVETSLMLAFLRDSNTSASVIQIINLLDKVLGSKDFSRLFPVILTDNGSEFSNQKRSKNVMRFHATERMYFTAIQVHLIKKEPAK